MAVPVTSVQPYWDLTFDAGGDPDPAQRDALLGQVAGLTDLVVFAHGWNNDLSTASALFDRFYAPFPGLLAAAPDARFGYAGVHWPSLRFSDEPIPDFPHTPLGAAPTVALPVTPSVTPPSAATPLLAPPVTPPPVTPPPAATSSDASPSAALSPDTAAALKRAFPGHGAAVDRITALLAEQPAAPERLAEFAALVRTVTGADDVCAAASDLDHGAQDAALPVLFTGEPAEVCGALADALAGAGARVSPLAEDLFGGIGRRVWEGARELLRQATYFSMKGRAGGVGRAGLGPLLGRLARSSPGTRVHLVGHSFGARLVSFALGGLPPRARNVASVTLLQGAFSHYAFSGPQPFDGRGGKGGALHGMQQRVAGPVVACHSVHDQALSVFYPVASRLSGADESLLGLGERWGALGHDGFQGLAGGAPALPLAAALTGPFPANGCVSVDASAVVRAGGPPAGAHSDICHEELARLVLRAAGRLPG